ncbi:kelch-like protein 21 isoform X1 [Sceloporus undulatus]|uniref:kelch-like protein 21 isoform X1 n=2 Tax=Sceloporus undulatus TaxID=8520 RepID=UPI001C4BB3AE|nr:kelch-like protein 21 isoform X1 [Sceloporus undulatus]
MEEGRKELRPQATDTKESTDTVLEVAGRLFPVHRWALACHSQYFEAMFFGGTREHTQRHICIQGVEAESFGALLDFTRTGVLPISRHNVSALLEAADFLQLEGAKRRCEAFLERELHVSNCLSLMAYAQHFACPWLHSAARHVALTHWAEVVAQGELEELPQETLVSLLRSDELFVPREDLVFEAVTRWVAADFEGREGAFLKLAGLVRAPFLSLSFLDLLVKRSQRPGQDLVAQLVKKLDGQPPPNWRGAAQSACAGRCYDTIFVLAGKHDQEQQELLQFQPKTGAWQACSPLKRRNLTQYAVAAVGNFLFVTGGYFREEFFWSTVDWVLIYNSWENSWLEGPAMKKARNSHCAVGVGFHLYVLGGSTEEGGIISDVERLAPMDSAWQSTSPLIHPVERAAAISVGTRVYVVCGLDENGDVCQAVQRLNVETDVWDVVSLSPLPRYDICVTALNGAIYTVGGGAFRFDADTGEWTPVEEEFLAGKFFKGCSTANGRIYLLAQRQGNGFAPNMVVLDPYLDLCQEVDPKLPCPLPIHAMAVIRRFDTWM